NGFVSTGNETTWVATLPATSMARIQTLCPPSGRLRDRLELIPIDWNGAPSTLISNRLSPEPPSDDCQEMVTLEMDDRPDGSRPPRAGAILSTRTVAGFVAS